MRAAIGIALIVAIGLSGCGRLRDDPEPVVTPSPTATEAPVDELAQLLDEATDSLDQVEGDLRTGDDAAGKE